VTQLLNQLLGYGWDSSLYSVFASLFMVVLIGMVVAGVAISYIQSWRRKP